MLAEASYQGRQSVDTSRVLPLAIKSEARDDILNRFTKREEAMGDGKAIQNASSDTRAEIYTKQRDQAASDLVRALLIVNGGGAAALLAFLQATWTSCNKSLAKPTISAMSVLAFGAVVGAAFHLFRYLASSSHQSGNTAEAAKFRRLYILSASLSLVAFIVGIAVVAVGAWNAMR
jgi:hypothetical protein